MYATGFSGVSRSCRLHPAARSIDDHRAAGGGGQHRAVDGHADQHVAGDVAGADAFGAVAGVGAEQQEEHRRHDQREDDGAAVAHHPAQLQPQHAGAEAAERRQRAGGAGRVVVVIGCSRCRRRRRSGSRKASSRLREVISRSRASVWLSRCRAIASVSRPCRNTVSPRTSTVVHAGRSRRSAARSGAGQGGADGAAGGERLDLGGGAVGDDPAAAHEHHPVGVGVGLLQVVGGEDDGTAAPASSRIAVQKSCRPRDVHAGGRLVEDQQLRVGQQRHGEPQPLLLAAGALADQPLADVGDAGPVQRLRPRGRAGRTAPRSA